MSAITFCAELTDDATVTIPGDLIAELGVEAGDEVTVRIEANPAPKYECLDQAELHRRANAIFAAADLEPRIPGKQSSDPLELEWGKEVEEKAHRLGLRI